MSVVFDGSQLYNRANFFGATTDPFTFMAWVYPTTLPTVGNYNNIGGQQSQIVLGMNNNGGTIRWGIFHPIADQNGTSLPVVNTWYHVAMTCIGQAYVLYVNGVQEFSGSNAEAGATTIVIGDFDASVGSADEWLGRIAAVKVWNRALPLPEIKLEMLAYAPQNRSGNIGCFPFDKGTTAAVDPFTGRRLAATALAAIAEGPPIRWDLKLARRIWDASAAATGGFVLRQQSRPFPFAPGSSGMSGRL
jgi:hypothetical protein